MELDLGLVLTFVLVLARTTAWVLAAPVFSGRGMTSVGRLALALALSMFIAPLTPPAGVPTDVLGFFVVVLGQVLVGLLLGWVTGLMLSAFETAGALVDLNSGMSAGMLLDPVSGNAAAVMSRFASILFVTLLFATNAHHTLVRGFVRSFAAVPPGLFPEIDAGLAVAAGRAMSGMMLAALEIAAPVLGALFLTEVALALAARFAPQANVFLVGLPLKILVALLATGSALVFLPSHLDRLVDSAVRMGARIG